MEYRSSEVKAGFFIFVSLVTLVAMIFVFGNLKEYFQTRKALPIVFNFTGGLEIGAPVRYAGLDVGRVSDIQLQDTQEKQGKDRVVVITQIDPDIQIKKNSTATIKTSGLMGGLYIDIRPGTSSSPPLETGQTLQGQDSFEFTQIGDMMEEVVLQVRRFLDLVDGLTVDTRQTLKVFQTSLQTVNEVIGDNKQSVQENLENLLKVSRELSHLLENNRDTIHGTLTHLASITEKADSLITDKNAAIIEIIDQTHRLTRELELLLADNRPSMTNLIRTMEVDTKKITSSIDSAGGSLEETLKQSNAILVENRRNLMELIQNLNETSRNLKTLTEDVKRNPWKLIRKTDEEPAAEEKPEPATTPADEIRMKRLDKVSTP